MLTQGREKGGMDGRGAGRGGERYLLLPRRVQDAHVGQGAHDRPELDDVPRQVLRHQGTLGERDPARHLSDKMGETGAKEGTPISW
jgi:hypothetical protein